MSREPAAKETKTTKPRKRAAASRAGSTRRKAPTAVAGGTKGSRLTKQYALSVLVAVVVIAGSVGVGISDAGQIDVTAVIEARNAKVAAGETPAGEGGTTSRVNVPVQNTNTAPNGGLRGAGDPPPPPPPPEPQTSTSTATSTEAGTATSTDAIATSSDETAAGEDTENGAVDAAAAEDGAGASEAPDPEA